MPPQVALIIVNWNGKGDTLECLASLQEDSYPSKQIIVVDNGSTDDSVAAIQTAFPAVILLETGANLGFTGGNNVGIRYALEHDADFIFLLNNDTTVEPDALSILAATLDKHSEYSMVTPVIHYFDNPGQAWFAGSKLDLSLGIAAHDKSRIPARDEAPILIPWASGCAMLVRVDMMRKLEGFDDRYFLNWEDVDLCLRLVEKGGHIALVPSARVYHKVGRSFAVSGNNRYYYVRNNLLLAAEHCGAAYGQACRYIITQRFREIMREIKYRRTIFNIGLIDTLKAIYDHRCGHYGRH